MTTTATKTTESVLTARRPLGNRIYRFLRAIPTWFLWILVLLWTVPTFSLFVNSFRTRDAQRGSDRANEVTRPRIRGGRQLHGYGRHTIEPSAGSRTPAGVG